MERRWPSPRHACAVALVVSGCQARSDPDIAPASRGSTTTSAAPTPRPSAASPPDPGPIATSTPAAAPDPQPSAPAAPATPRRDLPLDLTAVDGGAIVTWSRYDPDTEKSELLAARLDDRGAPAGPARLLRRTSGEVLALAISRKDGDAWIAWLSQLASDPRPRGLVAAMRVAADLASTSPPLTLGQFTDEQLGIWSAEVRVLDLSGETAAVAAAGAAAQCSDIVDGRRTACSGFDLFWLRSDGTFTRAGHFGADGGDPGLGTLVDVGTGVVLDAWAWHGGPTFAALFARHGEPASEPPVPLVDCRPPFVRAWTGAELVTLCDGDYAGEGEQCVVDGTPAGEGMCERLHVVRLGEPATTRGMPPLTSRRRRCHDGRPVLEVAWKGGRLRIDPPHPDARRDLELGVWTGRHALFLTRDGEGERWRCDPDGGFVLDGPLDLGALLDGPARAGRPASTKQ